MPCLCSSTLFFGALLRNMHPRAQPITSPLGHCRPWALLLRLPAITLSIQLNYSTGNINIKCMCFLPIYFGRQACGRTSRGHTGGRIQPLLSLVDRNVEFCVLINQPFSTCCVGEEKSQFVWLHRDSYSRPNVRRFRGCHTN